ncbi:MAG TPA: long-chain fatty acid--CoA ligase, partial [Dongiaceae bacterium]|nr:long-chain fatty acid--CoA ligase [Dongiaceae bacterium]
HKIRERWGELIENPTFVRAVGSAVDRVNAALAPVERIRRFAVLPESFTIDNAMLTPSLKIRRHKIRERWGELIEKLYERS